MAATDDDLYEFDAPNYFDFTGNDDTEVDESYFDFPRSAEMKDEGVVLKQLQPQVPSSHGVPMETPKRPPNTSPSDAQEKIESDDKDCQRNGEVEEAVSSKEVQQEEPSSHAVPTETPNRPLTSPSGDQEEVKPDDKENAGSNLVRRVRSVKRSSLKGISPNVGVRQSPRLAAIAKVHNSPVVYNPKALRRKSAARRSVGSTSRNSSSSPHDSQISKVHKLKIQNKPSIPKVLGMKGLSSFDKKDLETIATFKKKIANNKKKTDNSAATESSKSARPGPTIPQEFHFATDDRLRTQKKDADLVKDNETAAYSLSKPTKLGPTKPQEFHFATDSRIKNQAPIEENETVEFTRSLRSNTSSLNKEAPKGPTIPQPFNLTESRKGKTEEVNKFVSVAELNLKFHTKTPQRFRSKRAGSIDDLNPEGKKTKSNSGVTIPHTPNLITRERSRLMNYLTHEEMEQKAFEEAQKHAFKANPVNKKVFEAPANGYQVEKKIVTVPEPFNITDSKKDQRLLGFKFQEICERLGGSASSVASLPHGGIPSKWDKTNTKVQPFSFDLRDKTKLQRKQEMIQKVLEDEKKLAEFHAHPMPSFESGIRGVPHKKPPTPTKVVPFNLKVEERGNSKQEYIQRNLEEQIRVEKEQRKFLARSDAVVHKQPFVPEKSKKPLTDISGFTLNTEVRAGERMEYELHRKRKEDEILAAKREQEKRQEEEAAEEISRLRRNIIHKANPVRKYKPLVIEHAPQPPTVPISPNFATESRLRSRTRADSTLSVSSTTFTAE